MDIIFLSSSRGKVCSLGLCSPVHYIAVFLLVITLISASFYWGYSMGLSPDYKSDIQAWKKEIEAQKDALVHLQQEANANVDVLSSRIGLIQAQVMRLDALGRRIIELTDISEGEFNFEEIPALGGPVLNNEMISTDTQLEESILKLSKQLADREKQLMILEDLLLSEMSAEDIMPSGRPIKKGWLSSYYGMRNHPISGKKEMHKGVDFAGKLGDPVISVAKGIVAYAGKKYGYGNVIDIDHGNGYMTRYGHNSKLLVKVGQKVEKNFQIAEIGSSGRSTGPHVHFEVIKNGKQVNPIKYIRSASK